MVSYSHIEFVISQERLLRIEDFLLRQKDEGNTGTLLKSNLRVFCMKLRGQQNITQWLKYLFSVKLSTRT